MNSEFLFPYQLKESLLRFGQSELRLLSLEDIEQTIDQIYESLSRDNRPELLEELCPYFGVVWAAGAGLTQFLEKETSTKIGVGLGVLEIGCGLALPSLLMAQKGVPSWATDQHPDVPVFLRKNIDRNTLRAPVTYQAFDWMKTELKPGDPLIPPTPRTWILGSDILYERQHPEQVTQAVKRLIRPNTERVLIADPARPYLQECTDALSQALGVKPIIHVERCETLHPGKDVFVLDFQLC